LFFVIRDHIGTTPLSNLRQTLLADLTRIWSSLSKPAGLEASKIEDYFDFAFVALPHKILQPEKFLTEVHKLGTRFREGYQDPKRKTFLLDDASLPIFLPEYHRRIPADGFPVYAENIWTLIESNKDLDLPTQQELLAQFRCDEIAKEVLIIFDAALVPLETRQTNATKSGHPAVISDLGSIMNKSRTELIKSFEAEASRYHKGVYKRKESELISTVDNRLQALFSGQLAAAHKTGVDQFREAVISAVKIGQKKSSTYDFHSIVSSQKSLAVTTFSELAQTTLVPDTAWSGYTQELTSFQTDLDVVSSQLRSDEMRRLLLRIERAVKQKLSDAVALEFNRLGSGRGGSGAPTYESAGELSNKKTDDRDLWDRIWSGFTSLVSGAETKFSGLAKSLDASSSEVQLGLWKLRRKSWILLRQKLEEEVSEGNLLMKLRENFEDRFRYDSEGVPRVYRPNDDIEGIYTKAREETVLLVPLLGTILLRETGQAPPLEAWISSPTQSSNSEDSKMLNVERDETEDGVLIGGVDEDADKTLEEEMQLLNEAKKRDLLNRFRKTADGVFVEAKRGAIGGVTQVPLYFYGLLLALGWNEIVAGMSFPSPFSHSRYIY